MDENEPAGRWLGFQAMGISAYGLKFSFGKYSYFPVAIKETDTDISSNSLNYDIIIILGGDFTAAFKKVLGRWSRLQLHLVPLGVAVVTAKRR